MFDPSGTTGLGILRLLVRRRGDQRKSVSKRTIHLMMLMPDSSENGFRCVLTPSVMHPTMRHETILKFHVQPLAAVLLDLREVEQELALGFRKNFDRGFEIPNDHAVLLGGGLIIPCQFSQCAIFVVLNADDWTIAFIHVDAHYVH